MQSFLSLFQSSNATAEADIEFDLVSATRHAVGQYLARLQEEKSNLRDDALRQNRIKTYKIIFLTTVSEKLNTDDNNDTVGSSAWFANIRDISIQITGQAIYSDLMGQENLAALAEIETLLRSALGTAAISVSARDPRVHRDVELVMSCETLTGRTGHIDKLLERAAINPNITRHEFYKLIKLPNIPYPPTAQAQPEATVVPTSAAISPPGSAKC